MYREKPETGEIYHVYNRGVDKRVIFEKNEHYNYFVHLLYTLNDSDVSAHNLRRTFKDNEEGSTLLMGNDTRTVERERLVDILAFVLMPNHFHLLLKQNVDDGVPKFMQRLGTGYTMVFNAEHDRAGALFQGRYKSVHVDSNRYLLYLPHYIHLNPLALYEEGSTLLIEKLAFLEEYKWSSFPDYVGIRNFPSVTSRDFIVDIFSGVKNYKKDIQKFLRANKSFSSVPMDTLIDVDN